MERGCGFGEGGCSVQYMFSVAGLDLICQQEGGTRIRDLRQTDRQVVEDPPFAELWDEGWPQGALRQRRVPGAANPALSP